MDVWECKIGRCDDVDIPDGADSPMRNAVERAYFELTGKMPDFVFSGWGGSLTETEEQAINGSLRETY